LSCSEDKTARLWSLETSSILACYPGHNYPVWDVEWGPLGVYFATASYNRTARLWSADQIHPLRLFVGHLSDVDVRFSFFNASVSNFIPMEITY
jgi:transcription initiation factor TFIID subunit 5